MSHDRQPLRITLRFAPRNTPFAIRSALSVISRWATLATVVLMAWGRNWSLQLPGFDAARVPFDYDLPMIRLGEISACLAVLAYTSAGWPNFSSLRSKSRRSLLLALLGLIAWSALSIGWAAHTGLAAVQLAHLIIWIIFALMILCCDIPISTLAAYFLIGALIHTLFGIGQVARQHSLDQYATLGELPISPNDQWSSVVTSGSLRLLRAYGLSAHPNILGGYAVVALMLAGGLIARARHLGRALIVIAWTLVWLLLLITFSRSAWLAMLIGGIASIVLFARSHRLDRPALIPTVRPCGSLSLTVKSRRDVPPQWVGTLGSIGLISAALFVIVFQPFLLGRIDIENQPLEVYSIDQRQEMIEVAGRLIASHPLTGVGAANFIIAARDLQGHPLDWAHNVPLLVFSELGLPGFGFFAAMISALIVVGVRRWRQRSFSVWQALIGGALIAMLCVMMLDHYLWTAPQGTLMWATLIGVWLRDENGAS